MHKYNPTCGRQNNALLSPSPALPNIHILIPRTFEYISLHGKGKLRLQMELRSVINWP